DIGGIPELVRPGQTGEVFQSGSVDALASTLAKVAGMRPADVAAMGRAGRAWMEQSFTIERYRERLVALYARIDVRMQAE
ncbi:MAG: glycosyltransferase family 1 protein, partial [Steroidobacteraceae bacterium]